MQGDEREVIIFSCAVGADVTGRITAQISSLNTEGGHRRLNVAITRARREMVVFSSMNPEQIDLGRSNSRGIIDFKHFLEFAKNGPRAIAEAFASTGRDTESSFEEAVKSALEARNWVVHPQVGVSYFRVDLGIVHPDKPGVYLAGVEADGAQFHRSATARDRDKLRQAPRKSRLANPSDLVDRMVARFNRRARKSTPTASHDPRGGPGKRVATRGGTKT